jgi:ribonucleotide reductase alpha subunit
LLNNQISNKIIELNNMKNKISNNNNDDLINVINPGEKILSALFISTDQKITYAIPCKNTTPFVRVEEKLYEEYPEYKETENHFIHNGTVIKRFKTIGENNIKSGKPIILNTGN